MLSALPTPLTSSLSGLPPYQHSQAFHLFLENKQPYKESEEKKTQIRLKQTNKQKKKAKVKTHETHIEMVMHIFAHNKNPIKKNKNQEP